jgi:hypothetical protein
MVFHEKIGTQLVNTFVTFADGIRKHMAKCSLIPATDLQHATISTLL